MAEAIAQGIKIGDGNVTIKLFNIPKSDKNDIITEVFKSKAILVGSPTIGRGVTSSTAGILEEIEGLKFRGKKAAAFGCYGWSGESVKRMTEWLKRAGFETINEGIKCLWNPNDESIENCINYGKEIVNT